MAERPYKHADTVRDLEPIKAAAPVRTPQLTILSHPDMARVGEVFRLRQRTVLLSRLEPAFAPPGLGDGPHAEPLADQRVSRRPLAITVEASGGIRLDATAAGSSVQLDGEPVDPVLQVSPDRLDRGAVLTLGHSVALLLHRTLPPGARSARHGLLGDSVAVDALRVEIDRVARLEVPVLLRGESGSGKELVARALHDASPRAKGPFVAVNMAAIATTTATSELFGHIRGAFTGAARDHDGFFARADGGTLFLDEIGETPSELQPMLLRVLETGEVTPVGGARPRTVNVRVVAASDADLEGQGFRAPLLHRLSGYVIRVPSLRDRKDDIGRLFHAFLRQELEAAGLLDRLEPRTSGKPLVPPALMSVLCAHGWPGNVRELRNVARQLAIASQDHDQLPIPTGLAGPPRTITHRPSAAPAKPRVLTDDEMVEALEAHHWKPGPTAEALGISRTTLYALIDRSPRVRKARDLEPQELRAALKAAGGDLDAVAATLRVSKRGIQLRLKELDAD